MLDNYYLLSYINPLNTNYFRFKKKFDYQNLKIIQQYQI